MQGALERRRRRRRRHVRPRPRLRRAAPARAAAAPADLHRRRAASASSRSPAGWPTSSASTSTTPPAGSARRASPAPGADETAQKLEWVRAGRRRPVRRDRARDRRLLRRRRRRPRADDRRRWPPASGSATRSSPPTRTPCSAASTRSAPRCRSAASGSASPTSPSRSATSTTSHPSSPGSPGTVMRFGAVFPTTEIGDDPDRRPRLRPGGRGARLRPADRLRPRARRRARRPRPGAARPVHPARPVPRAVRAVRVPRRPHDAAIELATGVLVLPQRQTALVAKQAAEIDLLSGGRLVLGVGTGWNHVEYTSLGTTFGDRARRLDDQVAVLRALWERASSSTTTARSTGSNGPGSCPARRAGSRCGWAGRPRPRWRAAARIGDGHIFAGSTRSALRGRRRGSSNCSPSTAGTAPRSAWTCSSTSPTAPTCGTTGRSAGSSSAGRSMSVRSMTTGHVVPRRCRRRPLGTDEHIAALERSSRRWACRPARADEPPASSAVDVHASE